jgi:hypothetical protein
LVQEGRVVPVVRPYLEVQRRPVARWDLELARKRLTKEKRCKQGAI